MINKFPLQWDNIMFFVRFAECFLLLDSGLRRNDGLMDFLGLTTDAMFHYTKTENRPIPTPTPALPLKGRV